MAATLLPWLNKAWSCEAAEQLGLEQFSDSSTCPCFTRRGVIPLVKHGHVFYGKQSLASNCGLLLYNDGRKSVEQLSQLFMNPRQTLLTVRTLQQRNVTRNDMSN